MAKLQHSPDGQENQPPRCRNSMTHVRHRKQSSLSVGSSKLSRVAVARSSSTPLRRRLTQESYGDDDDIEFDFSDEDLDFAHQDNDLDAAREDDLDSIGRSDSNVDVPRQATTQQPKHDSLHAEPPANAEPPTNGTSEFTEPDPDKHGSPTRRSPRRPHSSSSPRRRSSSTSSSSSPHTPHSKRKHKATFTNKMHATIRDYLALLVAVIVVVDFLLYGFNDATTSLVVGWDAIGTIAYMADGIPSYKLRDRENQTPMWMLFVCAVTFLNYSITGVVINMILTGSLVLPSLNNFLEFVPYVVLVHFFPGDRLFRLVQGYREQPEDTHDDDAVHQVVVSFLWALTKQRSVNQQFLTATDTSHQYHFWASVALLLMSCEVSSLQHRYDMYVVTKLESALGTEKPWDIASVFGDREAGIKGALEPFDWFPVSWSSLYRFCFSQTVLGSVVCAVAMSVSISSPALFPVSVLVSYFALLWRYGNHLFLRPSFLAQLAVAKDYASLDNLKLCVEVCKDKRSFELFAQKAKLWAKKMLGWLLKQMKIGVKDLEDALVVVIPDIFADGAKEMSSHVEGLSAWLQRVISHVQAFDLAETHDNWIRFASRSRKSKVE